MWVYLKNRFVLEQKALISVFDRGFLYGDGIFETVRAYDGKIFLLSRHLDRLSNAARRLDIAIPKADHLASLLYETLDRNRLRNTLLRLTLTRGGPAPARGTAPANGTTPARGPTLVIFARPNRYPNALYQKGVTGQIVTIRRNGKTAQDPALKSISFLNNILAKQEAARAGAFEAILLNPSGVLAEGSTSNLFWIRAGRLYTPAASVGILAGITRGVVIASAKENSVEVKEGLYRKGDLFDANEAFLTNTGFELLPLIQIDQRKIGTGRPGRMTRQLHQFFQKKVRQALHRG